MIDFGLWLKHRTKKRKTGWGIWFKPILTISVELHSEVHPHSHRKSSKTQYEANSANVIDGFTGIFMGSALPDIPRAEHHSFTGKTGRAATRLTESSLFWAGCPRDNGPHGTAAGLIWRPVVCPCVVCVSVEKDPVSKSAFVLLSADENRSESLFNSVMMECDVSDNISAKAAHLLHLLQDMLTELGDCYLPISINSQT